MNIAKFNPFNWFRKEQEEQVHAVPVQRENGAVMTHPFHELHREMDRLFEDFTRSFGALSPHRPMAFPSGGSALPLRPTLDIAEGEKEYRITVELPGVSEKDIKVELAGDTLRISGEKRQENEEKGQNYHRVERSYGSFQRILNLPEDADADGIAANFQNGVMTLTVPRKAAARPETRMIEVKAS